MQHLFIFFRKKLLFLLCLMLCSFSVLFAQQGNDKYFDDGGLSNIKNVIKAGYDPLNGEIALLLEHKLLTQFSIEGGIGLVSLKKQYDKYIDDPIPGFKSSGTGVNLSMLLKCYYSRPFFDGLYFGTGVKFNFFDKLYTDVNIINVGYQLRIKSKFAIDLTIGAGFRFYKEISNPGTIAEDESVVSKGSIPLQIKVGYAF